MKEHKASNPLAIGGALSLVIAAVSGGMYLLAYKGPKEIGSATAGEIARMANEGYDLFKRASGDLYRALQFEPRVTIGGETVYEPASQISEIATASRDFHQAYTYEASWAGSTKRLELKGDFTAKAGFAVDGTFTLDISEDGSKVVLHHNEPVLLSCELKKLHVLKDEDGWWNNLQPKEREFAQNELLRRARERALDTDLKSTATENLLERIRPLQVEYSFKTESKVFP